MKPVSSEEDSGLKMKRKKRLLVFELVKDVIHLSLMCRGRNKLDTDLVW